MRVKDINNFLYSINKGLFQNPYPPIKIRLYLSCSMTFLLYFVVYLCHMKYIGYLVFFICLTQISYDVEAQNRWNRFLTPSDTLQPLRRNIVIGGGSALYGTGSLWLYHSWYKGHPQESFHLFDDWDEWNNMDKVGHIYSGYGQTFMAYEAAKWTGMKKESALTVGVITGLLFQTTIEVMDGFSTKWGFSIPDFASNIIGVGGFYAQEKIWKEQRLRLKFSSFPETYSDAPIYSSDGGQSSLQKRVSTLYGKTGYERLLKDYNAQIYWLSIDIDRFLPEGNRWPAWLDLAVGYSGRNMFGGFENTWEEDGRVFTAPASYQREKEFYLSVDIDLSDLHVKNRTLRTLFTAFSIFKIPSPSLEVTSAGEVKFYLLR